MEIANGTVRFGISIPLDDFAGLAADHLRLNPTTSRIESSGAALASAGFPEDATRDFIRDVCKWGGYSGVGGRVWKLNSPAVVSSALSEAYGMVHGPHPDVEGALRTVNSLKALGTPSFASKHLRFLEPRLCPVFDAYLQEVLPYSFGPIGYAKFADDCAKLATDLTERGVENPWRDPAVGWFAADAEAAIYVWASRRKSG